MSHSFLNDEITKAAHELSVLAIRSSTYSNVKELTEAYIKNYNNALETFKKYENERKQS